MVCMIFSCAIAEAQVNSTSFSLQLPKIRKTIEVRVEGINGSGNDWSILRDSVSCYPVIFSISNPLNREISIQMSCVEVEPYKRHNNSRRSVSYQTQLRIPAKSTLTRLAGIPITVKPVFSGNQIRGNSGADHFWISAAISENGETISGSSRLEYNCRNLYGGGNYSWSEVIENSEGVRTLAISPGEVAGKAEISALRDQFEIMQTWPVETLPQTSRPLSALQRLVLFGVNPEDLSKGQREAVEHAASRGLDVYLIGAADGTGTNWTSSWSNSSEELQPRVKKQGLGTWIAYERVADITTIYPPNQKVGSFAGRRNLGNLGVHYLDQHLRPGDPSDLTLLLMSGYVLLLIPGVFFTLKKKKKSVALLWLIPSIFVGSVVAVTVIGIFQFGVVEETLAVGGLIQTSSDGEIRALQVIEGKFDPNGSEWKRTLKSNEDLILDYESIQNFRSVTLIDNPDGTMQDIRQSYPRSLNFRIRSIPLEQPLQLAKPQYIWPENINRLPNNVGNDQNPQGANPAVNPKIGALIDVELLDRFGIDPDIRFIGLEGGV